MVTNGIFTFHDFYSQKYSDYHHTPSTHQLASPPSSQARLDLPTTTTIPTSYLAKLVSSTQTQSQSPSTNKLHKLADVIPFTYFYWILVLVAILLALTLIIVFICYCHSFVKNYRNRRRDSFTNFYRNRTANRRVHAQTTYQSTASSKPPPPAPAPVPPSSSPSPPLPRHLPTPPCPSKSLKFIDDQLYRSNVDVIDSPPVVRHDLFLREPLSTFTSSTPNSSSLLPGRLSIRSSDFGSNIGQSYESQRASMVVNNDDDDDDDDADNDSIIVDIN